MKVEKEKLILSVETATRDCSLAIFRGIKLCQSWRGDDTFSASEGLLREIQKLLRQAEAKLHEVELLTVTVGPGSFTGLRIGLAIVKGLAAAGQIPVRGIPTLKAMAFRQSPAGSVCSLISAGRNEFFAQIFRSGQNNNVEPMNTGTLEQLLIELKKNNDLTFVAPVETHTSILEFIESEKITSWIVESPPENLAICAGKLGLILFQQNNLESRSWQIIYGRDAIVINKK
ncbi:MAG: tRNA (adenosine(37)-N6)-threonylcarbamoyltransferase complex dimerization subunit type 1 TsaB [Pyrinomonadaceae bacterium]